MECIFLYHLSPIKNRESILKNGLIPKSKNGHYIKYYNRIFLFSDKDYPPFDVVSHFDVDMWKVKVYKNLLDKDKFMTNGCLGGECFYTIKNIKSKNIELFRTFI